MKQPVYDLRPARRAEVLPLFLRYHGYKSLGGSATYCFAVFEEERPVAAFAWQPPPPGAAKACCPEAPSGVLALSRMVALPREQRKLRHISKPLRRQMRVLIDRTRWPVLVTYSDDGLGHTGYVYKVSGWTATSRAKRSIYETAGARVSCYSNGKRSMRGCFIGHTWLQRWEHRVCAPGQGAEWMAKHGWCKVAVPGKVWASGQPACTWIRNGAPA